MRKFELKKIDIKSVAKIYLALGLIFALFTGVIVLGFGLVSAPKSFPHFIALSFLVTCLNAIIGALMAALITLIYNFIADKVGGVEIYVDEKKERYIAPGPRQSDDSDDSPDGIEKT